MGASASREKFRDSVSALIEVDVSADDADFWDELWKIPNSGEEVFELIPPSAARKLRDERFANLATLFTQATAQLCQIVETPYNIYFDQALNCVRVLTRILPFLLEKGALVACVIFSPVVLLADVRQYFSIFHLIGLNRVHFSSIFALIFCFACFTANDR
jgi:hypothetical protein